MYQYTISALQNIDNLNSHTGFIAFLFMSIILLALWFLIKLITDTSPVIDVVVSAIYASILTIITYVSFTTGEIIVRENTPVVAKLIGYVPEGYRTTGKHAADVHLVYMEVEVEKQRVLIATKAGVAIPNEMILYKNSITKYDK